MSVKSLVLNWRTHSIFSLSPGFSCELLPNPGLINRWELIAEAPCPFAVSLSFIGVYFAPFPLVLCSPLPYLAQTIAFASIAIIFCKKVNVNRAQCGLHSQYINTLTNTCTVIASRSLIRTILFSHISWMYSCTDVRAHTHKHAVTPSHLQTYVYMHKQAHTDRLTVYEPARHLITSTHHKTHTEESIPSKATCLK